MIITELELTNLRAYGTAKFSFKPGVNVIAGINGAGKSTALDAIRILMSRATREILNSRETPVELGVDDIRKEADFTYLSVEFRMSAPAGTVYKYVGLVTREDFVRGDPGDVRGVSPTIQRPFEFTTPKPILQVQDGQPLCIYFSPHRSLLTQEATKSAIKNPAFAQALGERSFNLRQVAEWWLAQEGLASTDDEKYIERFNDLQTAMWDFLPEQINQVRPNRNEETSDPELLVRKGTCDFDLFSLSEGEKGVVALGLEIARRLSLAYPELENPTREGSACILIDEIELHLHPQWQRDVLGWLQTAFPKCQFIVTTHSPQVIGEVDHDSVWYVEPGRDPRKRDRSKGMDSSRILEELMGATSRNAETEAILSEIADEVDAGNLAEAKAKLTELKQKLGAEDADVIRASGLIDFLEIPVDPD